MSWPSLDGAHSAAVEQTLPNGLLSGQTSSLGREMRAHGSGWKKLDSGQTTTRSEQSGKTRMNGIRWIKIEIKWQAHELGIEFWWDTKKCCWNWIRRWNFLIRCQWRRRPENDLFNSAFLRRWLICTRCSRSRFRLTVKTRPTEMRHNARKTWWCMAWASSTTWRSRISTKWTRISETPTTFVSVAFNHSLVH